MKRTAESRQYNQRLDAVMATIAKPAAIQKTPGVIGGDACIRDTRIAVWMLVELRRLGLTDAELLADYPTLTQRDLDAAWLYAAAHEAEIDAAIATQDIDD
jgi:uncharacterized protein (DUF433 family)